MLLLLSTAALAEDAAQSGRRLLISSATLGREGPGISAETFAQSLEGRDLAGVVPLPETEPWWNPPPGAKPIDWLSVVTTGFGNRGDAYAFMFAGPDRALSFLAHHRYEKFSRFGTLVWPDPLPGLADAFTRSFSSPAETDRALLTLEVRARGTSEEGAPASLDSQQEDEEAEALTKVESANLLPPLTAMAWAGAWQGGWAPTRAKAEHRVVVEVDFGPRSFSLLARYAGKLGQTAMLRRNVPEEQLQVEFHRLFLFLRRQRDVRHYGRLPATGVTLLSVGPGHLCYEKGGVLFGFDTAGDQLRWPQIPENGRLPKPQSYVSAVGPGKELAVFRWSGLLATIDPKTGAERQLLPKGIPHASGFAFGPDGGLVVAQGQRLRKLRDGEEVWAHDSGGSISSGPALSGDRAVVGTVSGALACVGLESGKVLWESRDAPVLHGKLVLAAPCVVGYDRAREELCAWKLADGSPAWSLPLGDVLLQLSPASDGRISAPGGRISAPGGRISALGGRILAAAKNNRIILVDAATGKVLHERIWPTWPLQVLPLTANGRSLVAVTDLDGAVTLLDQSDLESVRTIPPFASLAGNLLFAERLPVSRLESFPDGTEVGRDLAELDPEPSLIVTDREGFYYVLGVP